MRGVPTLAFAAILMLGCGPSEPRVGAAKLPIIHQTLAGWEGHELRGDFVDPVASAFGTAVAAFEGSAVIGAMTHGDGTTVPGGAALFHLRESAWQLGTVLGPGGGYDEQRYGAAVALNEKTLVVGGPTGSVGVGTVWLYERTGDALGEPALLTSPMPSEFGSSFGAALAMADDTLLVGDPWAAGDSLDEGAVYVYERQGDSWELVRSLHPELVNGEGSQFGYAVALRDGLALVGAPGEDGRGAVYVYDLTDPASERQRLAPTSADAVVFGRALALDASRLFVGDPFDRYGEGAVYAYEKNAALWQEERVVISDDDEVSEQFGSALAVVPDLLFVGAPTGVNGDLAGGRVQALSLDGSWQERGRLFNSEGTEFGRALAAHESTLVVGGPPGGAFVFSRVLGQACESDFGCSSGYCVEGVCCDSPCVGVCSSCLSEHKGRGDDGACGAVAAGTDPRNSCAASEDDCGTTGLCDASSACAFVPKGSACGEASCASSIVLMAATSCDGAGTCLAAEETQCAAGYLCRDAVCLDSCTSSDDCDAVEDFYCYAGECVAGRRCSEDATIAIGLDGQETPCETGRCHDGFCLEQCERTTDCLEGLVCHPFEHTCVPAEELKKRSVSSGCAMGRHAGSTDWASWVALLAFVLSVRRQARCKLSFKSIEKNREEARPR